MKRITKLKPSRQQKITIGFGYTLFIITLITLFTGTVVPLAQLFFSPNVLQLNVGLTLVSFTAAAVLPLLISYIVGDRATHSKHKIMHHYNGVLFGIAGYWLSQLFGFIGTEINAAIYMTYPENFLVFVSGWPIFVIAFIMAIIAITYVHTQKKKITVIEHMPYQLTLIGAVIGTFIYILVNQYYSGMSSWTWAAAYIFVTIILIAFSYKRLLPSQPTHAARLAASVVAVSMGFIASSLTGYLIPGNSATALFVIAPITAGVIVWATYLWLITRKG